MLALYPLWRKARRVYSLTSRLPGTNRLGFQPSLALSGCCTGCRESTTGYLYPISGVPGF
ncbi:MAG: hypothetical protein ABW170_01745 [Candidatus Thiodiazotropha sp. L084R]